MIKTLKVRLCPDKEQAVFLEKHSGQCRYAWNHFLEMRIKYYAKNKDKKNAKKGLTIFDTMKTLTGLKGEKKSLSGINSQILRHSPLKPGVAFKPFFKHNTDYLSIKGMITSRGRC